MTDALKDLKKIMEIEGISREDGITARNLALENWIEKWIKSTDLSQSIIKNNLTSEDKDFIIYKLASDLSEKLMEEDLFHINYEKNKVTVTLTALKVR